MSMRISVHHLKMRNRYGKEIYGDSATKDIVGVRLE